MAYISEFNNGASDIPIHPIFGFSDTGSDTQTKEVSYGPATNFDELKEGVVVVVHFMYTNTAEDPKLKVGQTIAKDIKWYTSTDPDWKAGDVVPFVYDGSYWRIIGMH